MNVSKQKELLLSEINSLFHNQGFKLQESFEHIYTKITSFGAIKFSIYFSEIGKSTNSTFFLSHKEVEDIILNVGVTYNRWVKQRKGKKLLYTLHDGIIDYKLNRFLSKRSNSTSNDSKFIDCLLYTSPSPRDLSTSRMPSSA